MSQINNIATTAAALATVASGEGGYYWDSTAKIPVWKNDAGRYFAQSFNTAVTAQGGGFAADTWLTSSDLLVPSFGLQANAYFKWVISASKTGAGVAAPVYTVRIGSGRATTDTSRLALTGPAQTAVADIGTLTILVTVRTVGSGTAAVLQGSAWWEHRGTAANTTTSGTGFANDSTGHVEGTSSGFDSTTAAGLYVSLSLNGGTSAVWSPTQVISEATW